MPCSRRERLPGEIQVKEEGGSALDLVKRVTRWDRLSEERRTDLVCLFLLFLTILVFFRKIVLHPDEMIYSSNSDIVEQFYPWHRLEEEALGGGAIPFWNEYNFGGEPLLANMQLGFFYPPNLILFSILPTQSVFGISFILHLFFAGATTYFLAKRTGLKGITAFLPAAVFIFSGYFMGHIYSGHYGQVCTASWIPMVLLVLDTALRKGSPKWGIALGGVVGLQFLAGHIQIVIFSGFICAVYFIYFMIMERRTLRKDSKWLKLSAIPAVAIPISVLISLIQFSLSYIYTGSTTRSGGMEYSWVTSYSLPPHNVITLLLPNVFGTPLRDNYWHLWNYWEMSFYMGLFTLVLLLLALRFRKERYPRFFMILGIFSLSMALGKYNPVYWIFYKMVPGWDLLRVPSRFVLILILCVAILSGFGLKRFMEFADRDAGKVLKRTFKAVIVISVILMFLALVMTIFQGSATDFIDKKIDDLLNDEELLEKGHSLLHSAYVNVIRDIMTTLILLSACAMLILWRLKGKRYREHMGTATVIFILFNLGLYHSVLIDTRDIDDIYHMEPYLHFLSENSEGYRVYDASDIIEDNYQIVYGFHTVKGYNPLELAYYQEMTDSVRNLSDNIEHPVLDLLGARYVVSDQRIGGSGFELVYGPDGKGIRVYENPGALPRSFLSANITVLQGDEVLEALSTGELDHPNEVLMEDLPEGYGGSGLITGGMVLVHERKANNEVLIKVDIPSDRILVLSQSYYHEWEVHVDGVESPLLRVYHGLTGVHLGPGEHEVRFVLDDLL